MRLRCLLVDDEPPAIEVIKTFAAAVPALDVVGTCRHAVEAFHFLQSQEVDLMFLDIQMPQLTGLELIKTLKQPPKVIFTTAHRDHALEAFEINALDYLLKPISFERFLKAIQKAVDLDVKLAEPPTEDATEEFLFFKSDRKMMKVLLNQILFVESLKDYVKIITRDKQLITKLTITSLEAMLPPSKFIRVHRSFIVAQQAVDSFSNNSLFIGKHEIPLGPLYRLDTINKLKTK